MTKQKTKPSTKKKISKKANTRRNRMFITGLFFALVIGIPLFVSAASKSDSYKFISTPDFMNADIGDVSVAPLYKKGQPNSVNEKYVTAQNLILNTIAAEGIKDVYVAGDLVEGHWGRDDSNTGTFGPVRNKKERLKAVARAGDLYYRKWINRFKVRNLNVYPAVGDHDIGDNPWTKGKNWYLTFKYNNIDAWRKSFNEELLTNKWGNQRFKNRPSGQASKTAYAVRPNPNVQLITVDVFKRGVANGRADVVAKLDNDQLRWLNKVLDKANADGVKWIIVQGHTPVVGPVRYKGSSKLMYKQGTDSAFWKTMVKHKVDLYLCGEVHDVTAHHVDGITQISHGGLFAWAGTNYMIGDINGDTMNLTVKQFVGTRDTSEYLWQTSKRKMPISVTYNPTPLLDGTMTLNSDNTIVSRTGSLDVYNGTEASSALDKTYNY